MIGLYDIDMPPGWLATMIWGDGSNINFQHEETGHRIKIIRRPWGAYKTRSYTPGKKSTFVWKNHADKTKLELHAQSFMNSVSGDDEDTNKMGEDNDNTDDMEYYRVNDHAEEHGFDVVVNEHGALVAKQDRSNAFATVINMTRKGWADGTEYHVTHHVDGTPPVGECFDDNSEAVEYIRSLMVVFGK